MAYRSDPKLVGRCLDGDQSAWNEIVERYGRLVYSVARRYGLDDADADDVFQGVFAALFQHLDRLRDQTRLSSWLITTTHRTCWRIGRRPGGPEDLDQRIVDVSAPSDENAAQWEQQQLVREGLARLGGQCEALLTALFLEPGTPDYDAVAARLEMPRGSIGPTRARCFKKLERILVELGIDPGPVPEPASSPFRGGA
jgi:RNA polymerase sigma factor (sigma-70 family)